MLSIANKNQIKMMNKKLLKNISKINQKLFLKINSKKLIKKFKVNLNSNLFNPILLIQFLQDKVNNLGNFSNNNHVVLSQSKFWARAITWLIMGSTGFAVTWLAVAETDEVVIAVGKLQPKSGIIDVQMPIEGVTSKVLVKEGDLVKKDQILILLDTQITESKNNSLQKNLELNNIIAKKLNLLVKEGAVSELQYLQQQEKIEGIKQSIQANKVQMSYQEIISPIDGMVFDLKPKGPGYVASTSEPVLKIVPSDNLLAKIDIDPRKIGFVKVGKNADISIDSFPASDFGVIEGTVTSIGSDALPPNPTERKGFRFPAKITLKNQVLKLKSGKTLPLQAGMSLTANIKLRKVTYLQLLLKKFSDKADSLKSIN